MSVLLTWTLTKSPLKNVRTDSSDTTPTSLQKDTRREMQFGTTLPRCSNGKQKGATVSRYARRGLWLSS